MKLRIATVQMTTDDRDKAGVVAKVLRMIDEAGGQGADLIVLPEVWTGLGYTDAYPYQAMAEPIPGPTTDKLVELARRHGAMIVGSMYEAAPDGRYFNAAPFIDRDGSILGRYRRSRAWKPSRALGSSCAARPFSPRASTTGNSSCGPGPARIRCSSWRPGSSARSPRPVSASSAAAAS